MPTPPAEPLVAELLAPAARDPAGDGVLRRSAELWAAHAPSGRRPTRL